MRVMIVAAHPDDETIGASGLSGPPHETIVVHATDGAPRDPRWWPTGISDRDAYAHERAREASRALALVGAERIALGFTDQEAALAMPQLTSAIADQIAQRAPDLIVTHAYEGGHPDHDAVAFAVARARSRARSPLHVYEMALYHSAPGALVVGEFIDNAGSVRNVLPPAQLRRRRAMLACFASQDATLAPFVALAHERYRRAPAYDFSRPPHDGPLLYERRGLPTSGAGWRALAARS
jgi:LmbE family N-acetylglucosaminyl deacetylase